MYFNPQSIISNMHDEHYLYKRAIERVLDSWDDRVSQTLQTSCIAQLSRAGNDSIETFESHSKTIEQLLDEMEMYARR